MNQLTERQTEVLRVIENYIIENSHPPSYRELASLCGLKSASTVYGIVQQLKKKDYVDFKSGSPRTLTIKNRGEQIPSSSHIKVTKKVTNL